MKYKKTARIENWFVLNQYLFGNVYDDDQGRFKDGEFIQTSPILNITRISAETKNSLYMLGKPKTTRVVVPPHALLQLFDYSHLPKHLQSVSKSFHDLAWYLNSLPQNLQKDSMMEKLLEAKDCAVRAVLWKEQV